MSEGIINHGTRDATPAKGPSPHQLPHSTPDLDSFEEMKRQQFSLTAYPNLLQKSGE